MIIKLNKTFHNDSYRYSKNVSIWSIRTHPSSQTNKYSSNHIWKNQWYEKYITEKNNTMLKLVLPKTVVNTYKENNIALKIK